MIRNAHARPGTESNADRVYFRYRMGYLNSVSNDIPIANPSVPENCSGTWAGYDQITNRPDHVGRVENPCLPGTRGHGRGISVHCLPDRKSPTNAVGMINGVDRDLKT
jgi:hypothetical protein